MLIAYCEYNTQATEPLLEWAYKIKLSTAKSLHELRESFANSVDSVGKYTVFNIGGNAYRLITTIHYNRQKVYTRAIWTHAEYSKRANQMKLLNGGI
ncbi:type II toxin-antitoxin system HigB family toxin [Cysteiniphilum halobium]|uniref:type II toxin-antitoxin system HigB family toxin n=1 Tax=Cysteiniphilum halobium TaxID=2219059 RepID=UPI001AAC4C57|nr:type II toxin-antitoxin system HigB family toxin [Cysteiniphilum halobium]